MYWLALVACPRFGIQLYQRLIKLLPNIYELFRLPSNELAQFGLSSNQVAFFSNLDWRNVERQQQWLVSSGTQLISIESEGYPDLLKQIDTAPLALFVQGKLKCLQQPQFAFVGSRTPSHYGIELAAKFAAELATSTNALVTSGMALGIDGVAHRACLNAGGETVAVLGSGFRHIYPKRHSHLARQIIEQGALVTEFLPDMPPIHYNFPRRNRIISGLCNGTFVIEAALKSGSLVTAKYALEQGREVFTLPGNINNPLSQGPHSLLRQGAKLVERLDDLIEDFVVIRKNHKQLPKNNLAECKLLASVDYDITSVDVIVQRSQLPIDKVLIELLDLEVQGLVAAVPGGYVRQA